MSDSVICCAKIATLDKKIVLGEIGFLPNSVLKNIAVNFYKVFGF